VILLAEDHELTGHLPTEVIKTFEIGDDGEIEEEIESESHRPEHTTGDHVKCSCGKEWDGMKAEEEAKKHLRRATASKRIQKRYGGTEYWGWKLHYDVQAGTLYWSYTETEGLPLSFYATPFYEGEDGIVIHMHNLGGEELLCKRLAEDYGPREVVEDYVEIMKRYIDNNWMPPKNDDEEEQEG